MSRVKLLFLSVMAVFAVGAVAASEASATPGWQVAGTAFTSTSSETVLGLLSNGLASLEATISAIAFDLLCESADATGTILGTNKDAAANGISFTGCTVSKPSGCTAVEPIVTGALSSELLSTTDNGGTIGLDTWTPTSGTKFAEISVSGSACSVEGKYTVTGQAQCEGAIGEAETFACLFNKNSGKELLTLGTNVADF
jgi:hypothetical protein